MVGARKTRVLLIDDEREFTDMVKVNLENTGTHKVRALNTGVNAAQVAFEWRPDVILLDLVMPLEDGADVYLTLKDHKRLRDIPIIVVSALAHQDNNHVRAGEAYQLTLAKPVTTNRLIRTIERAMETPEHLSAI